MPAAAHDLGRSCGTRQRLRAPDIWGPRMSGCRPKSIAGKTTVLQRYVVVGVPKSRQHMIRPTGARPRLRDFSRTGTLRPCAGIESQDGLTRCPGNGFAGLRSWCRALVWRHGNRAGSRTVLGAATSRQQVRPRKQRPHHPPLPNKSCPQSENCARVLRASAAVPRPASRWLISTKRFA